MQYTEMLQKNKMFFFFFFCKTYGNSFYFIFLLNTTDLSNNVALANLLDTLQQFNVGQVDE